MSCYGTSGIVLKKILHCLMRMAGKCTKKCYGIDKVLDYGSRKKEVLGCLYFMNLFFFRCFGMTPQKQLWNTQPKFVHEDEIITMLHKDFSKQNIMIIYLIVCCRTLHESSFTTCSVYSMEHALFIFISKAVNHSSFLWNIPKTWYRRKMFSKYVHKKELFSMNDPL